MKLVWSDEVVLALEKIVAHIATDNPAAAWALGEQIVDNVESILPDNPHAGRPGRVEETRELVVHESYIVAYEVTDSINILTVRHSAQMWPESF